MNDRRQHIFLIGFSGSGKSTIGPILAKKLQRRFVDIDRQIERQSGQSIAALFADRGESYFRRLESDAIRRVAQHTQPAVVALGGGAIKSAANRKILEDRGFAVYLRCSSPEIYRRLASLTDRPLLHVGGESLRHRITRLLNERRSLYRAAADVTVSTTNNRPHEVAREIVRRLGR